MKKELKQIYYLGTMLSYGDEVINSEIMKKEKEYLQHASTTTYQHSLSVTICCLKIVKLFNIKVDKKSLIRGALLHDYYLYDWHIKDKSHKWHGFTHAKTSLKNAERDFKLTPIEKNMILCHMFPMNFKLPKYRETLILLTADKICATKEIIYHILTKYNKY